VSVDYVQILPVEPIGWTSGQSPKRMNDSNMRIRSISLFLGRLAIGP
jgi:hypothetical protein